MAIIPKKTKFRLSFRNKIKTKKIKKFDFKQHKPFCTQLQPITHGAIDILNKKNAWCPSQYANLTHRILVNYILEPGITGQIMLEHKNNSIIFLTEQSKNFQITKLLNSSFLSCLSLPKTNSHKYNLIELNQALTNTLPLKICNNLLFGTYGFCSAQHGTITTKFVDSARLDIAKKLRKRGRIWIRICCDTPVTARPVETRMGKGKGTITHWEAKVRPGQLLFEFSGVSEQNIIEIFNNLNKKSAIELKLISN